VTRVVALLVALALTSIAPPAVRHVPSSDGSPEARAAGELVPNDTGWSTISGGWSQIQWNFAGPHGVNAPGAWANLEDAGAPGGVGVTVAVLDTGIAYANRGAFRRSPDLSATTFLRGYDFVDDDPYPFDLTGHGTHVASTIAEQTNNAFALTGLAYGVRIMPVRVLDRNGRGSATKIARGVRFAAENGAKIINMSLNFRASVPKESISVLIDAIQDATARGSLVVAAAGNDGASVIAYPARAEPVLGVGATTESGCVSSFSNHGAGIDLVAPGGGSDASLRDDPSCSPGRRGRSVYQLTTERGRPDRFLISGRFVGTSMATAHVSAVAALVVASGILGPASAPAAIAKRLVETARDLGARGYDERYGWGLVDASAATAGPPPQSR
jgi:serine protease